MDQTQQNFEVRSCNTDELRTQVGIFLHDLAIKNGWPAGYDHAHFASLIDPDGNIVGLLDHEIVSVISAVNYDDRFCFTGTFMTLDEHQKKGFGAKVFEESLKHAGNRITGLYAPSNMVEWYKKKGFKVTGAGSIYRLCSPGKFSFPEGSDSSNIVQLNDVNFDDLCRFDRKYFPAERREFLYSWLSHLKTASALVYVEDGVMHGYGATRQCMGDKVYKFSPLFANSCEVAQGLAVALLNRLPEGTETVELEAFVENDQTNILAATLGFTAVVNDVAVMYRNGRPDFDASGVFATTSGSFGLNCEAITSLSKGWISCRYCLYV